MTFQTKDAFFTNVSRYDNLRTTNLKGAWLSEIPVVVLNMTTLRVLDLSWNRITEVPRDIDSWEDLTSISFIGNQIAAFPEVLLNLPKLETVYASKTMDVEGLKEAYPHINFQTWTS